MNYFFEILKLMLYLINIIRLWESALNTVLYWLIVLVCLSLSIAFYYFFVLVEYFIIYLYTKIVTIYVIKIYYYKLYFVLYIEVKREY